MLSELHCLALKDAGYKFKKADAIDSKNENTRSRIVELYTWGADNKFLSPTLDELIYALSKISHGYLQLNQIDDEKWQAYLTYGKLPNSPIATGGIPIEAVCNLYLKVIHFK